MEEIKRFVIRNSDDGKYYTGEKTFGEFNKAKVFKNVGGAKVACNELVLHKWWYTHDKDFKLNLEIVEVITIVTDNVIKYDKYD
jgi:hypothetical protein